MLRESESCVVNKMQNRANSPSGPAPKREPKREQSRLSAGENLKVKGKGYKVSFQRV